VTNLVRSGECTSYADVMAKVLSAVREGEKTGSVANGGVAVPVEVLKEGVRAVREEVEKVVDVRVDDVDD